MENTTGIEVGDHVQVLGGFENRMTGQVVDVDVSGERPRFTLFTDGGHIRVGGFGADRLLRCDEGVSWVEDHEFWSDSARSWVASMAAPGGIYQMRVTDQSTSRVAPGDGFAWQVLAGDAGGLRVVDRGTTHGFRRAQQDAVRAVVWHGGSSGDR